jgi:hypothetical protein
MNEKKIERPPEPTHENNFLQVGDRSHIDWEEQPGDTDFQKAVASLDFDGIARAFHEGDIKWHAEEWKAFVEGIIAKARAEGRQEAPSSVVDLQEAYEQGVIEERNAILQEILRLELPFLSKNGRSIIPHIHYRRALKHITAFIQSRIPNHEGKEAE